MAGSSLVLAWAPGEATAPGVTQRQVGAEPHGAVACHAEEGSVVR